MISPVTGGQCATLLYVAQKINDNPELSLFGIVTNGLYWQLACLKGNVFTRYEQVYDIQKLDELYTALTSILALCKQQMLITNSLPYTLMPMSVLCQIAQDRTLEVHGSLLANVSTNAFPVGKDSSHNDQNDE